MQLRRLFCLTLGFLLLFPTALAIKMEDPEGLAISFNMKTLDEWIFVTPENYLGYMDLCTSRGCTAKDVHERFNSGRIVWEGYYTKLPEGCIRYEKWSDPYTRNVWSLEDINAKERKALLTEIEDIWSRGRYTYYKTFIKSTQNSSNNVHGISYSFNSNPPVRYESGLGMLAIQNGVAMSVSYVQFSSRASSSGYLKDDNTYSNMKRVHFYDMTPKYTNLVRQTKCVDLLPGEEWIVNATTDFDFLLTGTTEAEAQASIVIEEQIFSTKVDKDGQFSAAVRFPHEGLIDVSYRASKNKLQDNDISAIVSVNNSMPALMLTTYPLGDMPQGKEILLAGHTSAEKLTVQLDDLESVSIPVKDGTFSHAFTADPWVLHTLTVTASAADQQDCVIELPFHVQYENIENGIRDFKKAASSLNCSQLSEDPGAYVGELVRMEFYTTALQYTGIGLAFEANGLYNNKKYPMILLADGYIDDMIVNGMYITAYGIVSDPTLTEDPLPRIQLIYVTYQKNSYR